MDLGKERTKLLLIKLFKAVEKFHLMVQVMNHKFLDKSSLKPSSFRKILSLMVRIFGTPNESSPDL